MLKVSVYHIPPPLVETRVEPILVLHVDGWSGVKLVQDSVQVILQWQVNRQGCQVNSLLHLISHPGVYVP